MTAELTDRITAFEARERSLAEQTWTNQEQANAQAQQAEIEARAKFVAAVAADPVVTSFIRWQVARLASFYVADDARRAQRLLTGREIPSLGPPSLSVDHDADVTRAIGDLLGEARRQLDRERTEVRAEAFAGADLTDEEQRAREHLQRVADEVAHPGSIDVTMLTDEERVAQGLPPGVSDAASRERTEQRRIAAGQPFTLTN